MDKVCPLFVIGSYASPTPDFNQDCREERCAWWDENEERCCVPQLVHELDRIPDQINDLVLTFREQIGNLQIILNRP